MVSGSLESSFPIISFVFPIFPMFSNDFPIISWVLPIFQYFWWFLEARTPQNHKEHWKIGETKEIIGKPLENIRKFGKTLE